MVANLRIMNYTYTTAGLWVPTIFKASMGIYRKGQRKMAEPIRMVRVTALPVWILPIPKSIS